MIIKEKNAEKFCKTIVLNADYSFLNIVSWKKAMCILAKGKAEVIKYQEKIINTIDKTIRVPVVLRLIKLIRTLFRTKVPFSKKNVMVRDGFKCVYCGATNVRLTIDHLIPKAKGGKSTFENCVTSCKPCNSKKGDKLPSEIKMYPSKMPYQPTISQFLQEKMKNMGVEDVILDAMKG